MIKCGSKRTTFMFYLPDTKIFAAAIRDYPALSCLRLDGSSLSTYMSLLKVLPVDTIIGDGFYVSITVSRTGACYCEFSCFSKGKRLQCCIPIKAKNVSLEGGLVNVEIVDEDTFRVEKYSTILTVPLYMGVMSKGLMSTEVVIPFELGIPTYMQYVIRNCPEEEEEDGIN